jgi:hypothetical protein
MIGHGALFTAALGTSLAAALYLAPSTASAGCTTRLVRSQTTARMLAGQPEGVSIHRTTRRSTRANQSRRAGVTAMAPPDRVEALSLLGQCWGVTLSRRVATPESGKPGRSSRPGFGSRGRGEF